MVEVSGIGRGFPLPCAAPAGASPARTASNFGQDEDREDGRPATRAAVTGDDPESLRALSRKCRSLARGASRTDVAESLNEMADSYARQADKAEAAETQAHTRPSTTG
jgi:hypothetical protein